MEFVVKVLNGWKEIAASLNLTSRSARRWELLGLPVRRVSGSSRSPVIAFSDEIEDWLRAKKTKTRGSGLNSLDANTLAFQETYHKSRKLLAGLRSAGIEQRKLLAAIRHQLGQKQRALSGPLAN